jgi:hypothetical protein
MDYLSRFIVPKSTKLASFDTSTHANLFLRFIASKAWVVILDNSSKRNLHPGRNVSLQLEKEFSERRTPTFRRANWIGLNTQTGSYSVYPIGRTHMRISFPARPLIYHHTFLSLVIEKSCVQAEWGGKVITTMITRELVRLLARANQKGTKPSLTLYSTYR